MAFQVNYFLPYFAITINTNVIATRPTGRPILIASSWKLNDESNIAKNITAKRIGKLNLSLLLSVIQLAATNNSA